MSRLSEKQNRQTTSRDDEARLFPSYSVPGDEVPIVPGATFKKQKSLQGLAPFRPMDRLSNNSARQSGPVRAQGRPRGVSRETNLGSRGANFEISVPRMDSNADVEELHTRPAKRQRRDGSMTISERSTNLTSNDSVSSSPTVRRSPRLSPASSELSVKTKNRASAKLPEFVEVEKNALSYRSQKKPKSAKRRRSLGLSSVIELSDSEQPTTGNPPQQVIQSVEIGTNKKTPSDDRRHSMSTRESPDELQGGATVQPVPRDLDESHHEVAHQTEAARDESISTPNIWKTALADNNGRRRSNPKNTDSAAVSHHRRLFEATLFRFGTVERLASDERPIELHIDNRNGTIELPNADADSESGVCKVSLQKVREILRGTDDSRKIGLNLSSSEGAAKHICIETSTVKEKEDLSSLIAGDDVKVQEKPKEWMDKCFRRYKAERNMAHVPSGMKRLNSVVINESVPQPKAEVSKRPKLSASLQDSPGTATGQQSSQPSQSQQNGNESPGASEMDKKFDHGAHSHPPRNDLQSGIAVEVKRVAPKRSNVRETRSMMRRDPSPLVCDDDDEGDAGGNDKKNSNKHQSQPENGRKDKRQKWKKSLVYPRSGKKKAEIDYNDRERLRDNEFLNDNLIGFYIRFLEEHLARTDKEVARRVYFFNSYFFATLTTPPKGKRGSNYEGVEKWTRNVDLFSYDYIVVPINESAHWYVAIICNLRGLLDAPADSAERVDAPAGDTERSTQKEPEIQEVPETPELVTDSAPAWDPATAPSQGSHNETEETTRQSFASMNISDTETDDRGNKEAASAANGDWPKAEENQTTTTAMFPNLRSSANKEVSKKQGGDTTPTLSQKARKGKKKIRNPRPIDPSRPAIITFDSLDLTRQSTVRALKDYLYQEARSKRSIEIDIGQIQGMKARAIPLQHNFSDCGLYLLAYIEKFVQNPDNLIKKLLRRETNETIGWPSLESGLLRRRLRTFLDELYVEQDRINRHEGNDENTLADRKPVSFLLGSPELNQAEADASAKELQRNKEATSKVPSKSRRNGTDDSQKGAAC